MTIRPRPNEVTLQDGGHTALRSDPPPFALAQGATFHSDWVGNIAARTSKLRQ